MITIKINENCWGVEEGFWGWFGDVWFLKNSQYSNVIKEDQYWKIQINDKDYYIPEKYCDVISEEKPQEPEPEIKDFYLNKLLEKLINNQKIKHEDV